MSKDLRWCSTFSFPPKRSTSLRRILGLSNHWSQENTIDAGEFAYLSVSQVLWHWFIGPSVMKRDFCSTSSLTSAMVLMSTSMCNLWLFFTFNRAFLRFDYIQRDSLAIGDPIKLQISRYVSMGTYNLWHILSYYPVSAAWSNPLESSTTKFAMSTKTLTRSSKSFKPDISSIRLGTTIRLVC